MKATKHPDGRIEFEGTPEEVAQALGLDGFYVSPKIEPLPSIPNRPIGPVLEPLEPNIMWHWLPLGGPMSVRPGTWNTYNQTIHPDSGVAEMQVAR